MAINVLISCARKSKEKMIIKEWLATNPNIGHVYDCNDTPTDYNRETTKQDDIDRHIREVTDWFIFLCPFDFVGDATFHELQVAIQAKSCKTGLPMISLFFSKDPKGELDYCNEAYPDDQKISIRPQDISREKIKDYLEEISLSKSKRYDPDYYVHGELISRVNDELHSFINHQLRLRRYETPCNEVLPFDIFFDYNRTKPENGFAEDVFRKRSHDKEMLLAGRDHILLCGAPASGKSRSVLEYIKSFGDNPKNKFITVRGAQNLTGSGVGHRCISLSKLVGDIINYDSFLDREDMYLEVLEDQHYFIVIDQIDSMLGEDLSQLEALFHHASSNRRPSYQLLLTTTPSGYDANRDLFAKFEQMVCTMKDGIQCSYQLRTIYITNPSYDDALWVWEQLGDKNRPMPKGNVIGDFIYKLASYNSRLIDEARQFKSNFSHDLIPVITSKKITIKNVVAAFVRSVQLVRLMRHNGQLPLCLVLMTMKEELWQAIIDTRVSTTGVVEQHSAYLSSKDGAFLADFAADVRNLINQYLIHNNIIVLSKDSINEKMPTIDDDDDFAVIWNDSIVTSQEKQDKAGQFDMEFDFDLVREYDHEKMTTIVSPDIKMTIINDQVWDLLCDCTQYDFYTYRLMNGRHTASTYSRQEAKRAMNVWYHTFGLENPVNTMIRMIIRSPLDKLDKLQGIKFISNADNNFSFVWDIFCKELKKENSQDPQERERALSIKAHNKFSFLYILLVARMGNIEKIKATIKKKDGSFKPIFMSYDLVGELYGQAFGKVKALGFWAPSENDDYCELAKELFKVLQQSGVETSDADMLYYYYRQIQIRSRYKDANEYFKDHHIADLIKKIMTHKIDDVEEWEHHKQSCRQVMMAMATLILADNDFDDWLQKMQDYKMDVSFANLSAIIHLSTRGDLNCKLQHKLFREILNKADNAIRIPCSHSVLEGVIRQYGVVMISEMLKMVPSLVGAREVISKATPWLEENLVSYTEKTREVWESHALTNCNPYEFNFLLKDILDPTDGSVREFWSENDVLREKLLSCTPNYSDTWELYQRLYRDTDKALKHEVTPYVFMNIYKNISKNYMEIEKETVNRTYECFLQLLEDDGIYNMIKRLIVSGEYVNQRIFTKIYTTIVTKKQEKHFSELLGESAWATFCEQEETNVMRVQKQHIYNIDQVLEILKTTVQRQKDTNGLIDDSLFNNAVIRLIYEKRVNNPKAQMLYDFLHELMANDSEYSRRIAKSNRYYKSMHALDFKDVPIVRFNDKDKQPDRKGYWIDKDYGFYLDLRQVMRTVCKQTIPTEKEVDDLFDNLERLPDYPLVMPDMNLISLLLRNRLPDKFEHKGREFRDLTPREVLLIAKCVFGKRNLPLTTSILNGILEGFANYFVVHKETEKINKADSWEDFQSFLAEYAPFVHFCDTTYFQLLKIWPDKLNDYKGEIDRVCHRSERLLNKIMELEKNGASVPAEWHYYYGDTRDIIGQKGL